MARRAGSTGRASADAWTEQLCEAGYSVVAGLLDPREVEELRVAFPPETPG